MTNRHAPLGRDPLGSYRMDWDVCKHALHIKCEQALYFDLKLVTYLTDIMLETLWFYTYNLIHYMILII